MKAMDDKSDGQFSAINLPLDELVELLPTDGLIAISTDRVDELNQLLLSVAVLELVTDVLQVAEGQLTLALNVQKGEVGTSSLFVEGASLRGNESTMRLVSSFRNCSKSRAAPWVLSLISWRRRKTNSYLVSSPRVPAVRRTSLTSARLWRGSA